PWARGEWTPVPGQRPAPTAALSLSTVPTSADEARVRLLTGRRVCSSAVPVRPRLDRRFTKARSRITQVKYSRNMKALKKLALCLVVAAALLGSATPAHATFQMRITSSLGGSVTITDQDFTNPPAPGTAPDANATLGVITFSGGVGGFTIQVNTGSSK